MYLVKFQAGQEDGFQRLLAQIAGIFNSSVHCAGILDLIISLENFIIKHLIELNKTLNRERIP